MPTWMRIFLQTLALLMLLFSSAVYAETVAKTPVPAVSPQPPAPPEGTTDNEITDKINRALAASKLLVGYTILATSTNGFVVLSGAVSVQAQADEAIKIAKSVFGVKDVKSNIIVQPAPKTTTIIVNPH